jgi:hypothetical protein
MPQPQYAPVGVPPTPVAGGEEEFDQIFNQ